MVAKCTDKYKTTQLDILTWAFVFVGVGEILGTFVVFAEHENSYEVNKFYELEIK